MSTKTTSQLTAMLAGNLDDTAVFWMDDKNGHTRKATVAQVRTQLFSTSGGVLAFALNDTTGTLTIPNVTLFGSLTMPGGTPAGYGPISRVFISQREDGPPGDEWITIGSGPSSIHQDMITPGGGSGIWGFGLQPVMGVQTNNSPYNVAQYTRIRSVSTDASPHTVTEQTAQFIDSPVIGANITVTTAYGIHIKDVTGGGTNYAIYTHAGLVHFGSLAGSGSRTVVAAADGTLSAP